LLLWELYFAFGKWICVFPSLLKNTKQIMDEVKE